MTGSVLTVQRLKEVLLYNEETGEFIRRDAKMRSCNGTVPKNPRHAYLKIGIDYKIYAAHRLAWLYVYGEWPAGQVDHINGDKLDNRISNLRVATPSQNKQNTRRARSDSRSGLIGATWYSQGNKWRAAIQVNGSKKHLGYFKTAEEAHAVYMKAKRDLHDFCPV